MGGYEPGDPVRVELLIEDALLVLEGVIIEAIREGLYRVRVTPPKELGGIIIERIVVRKDDGRDLTTG